MLVPVAKLRSTQGINRNYPRHRAPAVLLALVLSMLLAGHAQAAGLAVRFSGLTSPRNPGQNATASVVTKAGATCSIAVTYSSGVSRGSGLSSKRATSAGRVSWTWKVGTRTHSGRWPVKVTCRSGSSSGSATRYLVVR